MVLSRSGSCSSRSGNYPCRVWKWLVVVVLAVAVGRVAVAIAAEQ